MLSIIIPAYNEEKRIGNTLKDYYDYFYVKKVEFEIIVETDGCTDRTVDVVKSFRKDNIISLNFANKLGKGKGIIKGLEVAQGDVVGFVDADESVSPGDFDKMVSEIGSYECVIASRRVKGVETVKNWPAKRRIASKMFNMLVNLVLGLNIRDTQCGAKVFTKRAANIIVSQVKTKGYVFDVDVLWRMKKNNIIVKEFPVKWIHAREGQLKIRSHAYKMFFELIKLRFSK